MLGIEMPGLGTEMPPLAVEVKAQFRPGCSTQQIETLEESFKKSLESAGTEVLVLSHIHPPPSTSSNENIGDIVAELSAGNHVHGRGPTDADCSIM
jgi:hypothetical protein